MVKSMKSEFMLFFPPSFMHMVVVGGVLRGYSWDLQ